jgi:hypothetical protein
MFLPFWQMMAVSFGVVTLWLLLSIIENIGPVKFRPFDGAAAMLYLTPILTLYWGRKQQEAGTTPASPDTVVVANNAVVATTPTT